MAKKKFYMVLDTETANGLDDPLVYDIGFAIIDKKGQVYLEKCFNEGFNADGVLCRKNPTIRGGLEKRKKKTCYPCNRTINYCL